MKPFTLVGVDGNAFSVMAYVTRAMRTAGMSIGERQVYQALAMSGDYNNLIVKSVEMIDKVNEKLVEQGKLPKNYDEEYYYDDEFEDEY